MICYLPQSFKHSKEYQAICQIIKALQKKESRLSFQELVKQIGGKGVVYWGLRRLLLWGSVQGTIDKASMAKTENRFRPLFSLIQEPILRFDPEPEPSKTVGVYDASGRRMAVHEVTTVKKRGKKYEYKLVTKPTKIVWRDGPQTATKPTTEEVKDFHKRRVLELYEKERLGRGKNPNA